MINFSEGLKFMHEMCVHVLCQWYIKCNLFYLQMKDRLAEEEQHKQSMSELIEQYGKRHDAKNEQISKLKDSEAVSQEKIQEYEKQMSTVNGEITTLRAKLQEEQAIQKRLSEYLRLSCNSLSPGWELTQVSLYGQENRFLFMVSGQV